MSKSGSAEPILGMPIVRDRDSRPSSDAKDSANRQRQKIREIGEVLRQAGFVTLNEQASALGLGRSTTWMILRADHKCAGLHAELICRMLSRKDLPPAVREVLREYVIEKALGHFGHSLPRRRCFAAHFSAMPELADFLETCGRTFRKAAGRQL